jgi:hypothetical protein
MDKNKSAAQLLKERNKRIDDAAKLKVPDRVPVMATFSYFPAKYTGLTCEDAYFNTAKWIEACKKTMVDFAPDLAITEMGAPGPVFETLGCKQLLIPGRGIPANHTHQFVEAEYMKANEFDALIADSSDYATRTYVPRNFDKLKALSILPRLNNFIFGFPQIVMVEMFARPEFVEAFESLMKAGKEAQEYLKSVGNFNEEMEALGFPSYCGGVTLAPYDMLPDMLRGMKGSMLDMYRQPNKVIQACEEVFLPMCLEKGLEGAESRKNKRVFIPLHRGSEGFMSLKQFEAFYWPTFKKLLLALIDAGLTPVPFFEGDYTSRLKYLLELPKGSIICHFDTTDINKAKEIIGGHLCIMGNIPASILQTGTPDQVKEYSRKLIDVVGKDGGYIMCCRGPLDEADPALLKVWIDYTKEYGVYG